MMWRKMWTIVVLPLGVALACGGKSDGGDSGPVAGSPEGKEASCEELCEDVAACGFDVADCAADCAENDSISGAGQQALTTCLGELGCDEGLDEFALLGALLCLPDELEDVELSATQASYCSESVPRLQACVGDPDASVFLSCEDSIALASDELVDDMADCASEDSCEDVELCVAFTAFPLLSQLLTADDPTDLDANTLADIMALLVVLGPVGFEDSAGGDFGGFLGPAPGAPEPGGIGGSGAN